MDFNKVAYRTVSKYVVLTWYVGFTESLHMLKVFVTFVNTSTCECKHVKIPVVKRQSTLRLICHLCGYFYLSKINLMLDKQAHEYNFRNISFYTEIWIKLEWNLLRHIFFHEFENILFKGLGSNSSIFQDDRGI